MECLYIKKLIMKINKSKGIGKVLFVVEGEDTEFYILRKIFTQIFDYQCEELSRNSKRVGGLKYRKYNNKINPFSSIFVVNTEESNIKFVDDENEFLNQVITQLRYEYRFPVDNAAIYYIFDRDCHSNTNAGFIRNLMGKLRHSRDNNGFLTSGLLLLSYPSVESFTLSNFNNAEHEKWFSTGTILKQYNNGCKINHQKINTETLIKAVLEMINTLNELDVQEINPDDFYETNIGVFDIQEGHFTKKNLFRALSFLCVALLDLGLIEEDEEQTNREMEPGKEGNQNG